MVAPVSADVANCSYTSPEGITYDFTPLIANVSAHGCVSDPWSSPISIPSILVANSPHPLSSCVLLM